MMISNSTRQDTCLVTGHAAGDTAVYTCARDHVLVGGEERLCQDTRTWTGADPYCKHQGTGNPNLCQNLD